MVYIYCDGASRGNPGPGGFGVVVLKDIENIEIYNKYYNNITNNQGELKGLLLALGLATTKYKDDKVRIFSDSAYCVNMFNNWIYSWASNGWKNTKNQIIENYNIVLKLYDFAKIDFPNFSVEKVPGHSGILGNELADAAASNNQAKLKKIFLENKDSIHSWKIFDFS